MTMPLGSVWLVAWDGMGWDDPTFRSVGLGDRRGRVIPLEEYSPSIRVEAALSSGREGEETAYKRTTAEVPTEGEGAAEIGPGAQRVDGRTEPRLRHVAMP